jgi:CBS domain-containing protein
MISAPTSAPLLAGLTVRDAMQMGIFNCPPDTDLRALARMMVERSIHCVVVREAEAGHRLSYGIVSDLDLMEGLQQPGRPVAGEIAKTPVVTVQPRNTLETAARLMTGRGTSHLVVVSPETGFPVGIVSSLDVARLVSA